MSCFHARRSIISFCCERNLNRLFDIEQIASVWTMLIGPPHFLHDHPRD